MNELELYRKMFLIRKVEQTIQENYFDDEMKTPMHMTMGGEAISVGVCSALGDKGQFFATYRSHGPYLASGGDLKKFFAEMYGKKEGRYRGKAGSMHIASPETGHISSSAIVASNIPVAVGAAYANKRKKNGKIVAVFFGDGATEEGNFWESINMACLWKLPIMFICEDNRLAVHTPQDERHGYKSIGACIDGFKINVAHDYGMNVQEVYIRAKEWAGQMNMDDPTPVFLHLEYYRYLEHVGVNSDTHEEYRKKDWEDTKDNDPIMILRNRLIRDNFPVEDVEEKISKEIKEAMEFAKKSPISHINELHKDVFYG